MPTPLTQFNPVAFVPSAMPSGRRIDIVAQQAKKRNRFLHEQETYWIGGNRAEFYLKRRYIVTQCGLKSSFNSGSNVVWCTEGFVHKVVKWGDVWLSFFHTLQRAAVSHCSLWTWDFNSLSLSHMAEHPANGKTPSRWHREAARLLSTYPVSLCCEKVKDKSARLKRDVVIRSVPMTGNGVEVWRSHLDEAGE